MSRLSLRHLVTALGLAAGLAAAPEAEIGPSALMPRVGDHTLLSWREGPPYGTNLRYSAERRFLRLETGYFAADFDTEKITLTGFAPFVPPRNAAAAAASALAAATLPPAQWQIVVQVGAVTYRCVGRRSLGFDSHGLPAVPLDFPVQVIESGRFFQKFALHDLDLQDPGGARLPARVRLEVAAWPARWSLTLKVQPDRPLAAARAFLRMQSAGGQDASATEAAADWPAGGEHQLSLTLGAEGAAVSPAPPAGVTVQVTPRGTDQRATVGWNAAEGVHHVRLEGAAWPVPAEGIYPEEKLDAQEEYGVILENRSDRAQEVRLNFEQVPGRAITGFVPMLLDARGRPSGIPIQVSKNWHQVRGEVQPPHAGNWQHGRTQVWLAPGGRVDLRHVTTFARWGGLPTASLAQLSLVGWGHNGFWEQLALGSFGESICFQPARVMRRALLTDFRPLLQRGFAHGERWAWATNVGGGDTLVWHDARGRYVPLKRNVTRHLSPGPNLAGLEYEEVTADEAIRSRVAVWLPQAEDHVRVYVRVHYEVRRPVRFSRLALFQLGADLYNDVQATRVAWGNAAGLAREIEPAARETPAARWEGRGEAPWVSLHGQARADAERTGQASRGLIVREWRARLGGRTVPAPWFAAVRGHSARAPLGVDLVPPPGLVALEPGDEVELLLELVALPLAAERYYGPAEEFRSALAAGANTWRLVQREAAGHRPWLERPDGSRLGGFPLTFPVDAGTAFRLHGGLGAVPVRLEGLTRPEALRLRLERADPHRRGGREELTATYWQSDYEPATGRWTATYTLPAGGEGTGYRVTKVEAADEVATPVR